MFIRGGFAGTVLAEQAEDLPALDLDGDAVVREDTGELLGDLS